VSRRARWSGAARLAQVALLGVTLFAGCGGKPATAPSDVVVGTPVPGGAPETPLAPPPRDTADLAVRVTSARAMTLVHVEAFRGHPLAPQLASWFPFRGALEKAGIDVARDIDRVLLAGRDPREWNGTTVFEHHIPQDKLEKFATAALESSDPPGERLRDGNMVGVRVHTTAELKGQRRPLAGDIWLPTPTLIVVLPPNQPGAASFVRSGGLPLPTKGEGASAWALEPHDTFANSRVTIPDTISRVDGWLFPKPGGSVHVELRGRSTDEDQARNDARKLTGEIDHATSVKIGPLTVRVFPVPPLRAEGSEVVGEIDVTRTQLEQLLAVAGGNRPKY
jgi:hypothetical protein